MLIQPDTIDNYRILTECVLSFPTLNDKSAGNCLDNFFKLCIYFEISFRAQLNQNFSKMSTWTPLESNPEVIYKPEHICGVP